jgi:L-fuculose-phosphate aldolase
MNGHRRIKRDIIEVGHWLWEKGFVASNDGNISVRTGPDEIWTTPTGVSKGFMTPDMIIRVDTEGKPLDLKAKYRASSELKMHLRVYRERPDVKAVVHTHPPFATSFAVAGIPLDHFAMPEAVQVLGAVGIAPYGTPSTEQIPDSIAPFIRRSDAVLLANHGALTLGGSLMEAYFKMETLEHSARIVFQALQLGNLNRLPPEEIDRLMELREKFKMPGRVARSVRDF